MDLLNNVASLADYANENPDRVGKSPYQGRLRFKESPVTDMNQHLVTKYLREKYDARSVTKMVDSGHIPEYEIIRMIEEQGADEDGSAQACLSAILFAEREFEEAYKASEEVLGVNPSNMIALRIYLLSGIMDQGLSILKEPVYRIRHLQYTHNNPDQPSILTTALDTLEELVRGEDSLSEREIRKSVHPDLLAASTKRK